MNIIRWCREVRMKMLNMIQSGDTLVDARQGNFTDVWEQLITPPSAEEQQRENPVEKRLRELAAMRQPERIELLANGTDATSVEG